MIDTPIHLRPIDEAAAEGFYARIRSHPMPLHVRIELDAFRESRTPWDALRLANALRAIMMAPEIVKELDALARSRDILVPKRR